MGQKVNKNQLNTSGETAAGKSGYAIKLGNVVICTGFDAVSNAGTTLNLPYTYSSTPWSCVVTTRDPNNQTGWYTALSTTQVTLKQAYTSGSLSVSWVVIGPA